jgi:hypothetical protein
LTILQAVAGVVAPVAVRQLQTVGKSMMQQQGDFYISR